MRLDGQRDGGTGSHTTRIGFFDTANINIDASVYTHVRFWAKVEVLPVNVAVHIRNGDAAADIALGTTSEEATDEEWRQFTLPLPAAAENKNAIRGISFQMAHGAAAISRALLIDHIEFIQQ